MKRLGAARGTGRGYKNLRAFPRDSSIHRDSRFGRKQPQQIGIAVRYNQIEPFSDRMASYKGKMYMTREDLKRMPDEVHLLTSKQYLKSFSEDATPPFKARIKYGWKDIAPFKVQKAEPFEETATRELELYTENDADLYRQMRQPIELNLQKKKSKGIYDKEKARKAFLNLVNVAARKYTEEFSAKGDKPSSIFKMADRREVARRFEEDFEREYNLENR
jgi:hypothetical protein